MERNILLSSNPFLVKLRFAFQTETKLYLVMEYLSGGDLLNLLAENRKFNEEACKFYLAEIVAGIEYLHNEIDVIYRDLKPDNVLLKKNGHIKLTDFGLSKQYNGKAYS